MFRWIGLALLGIVVAAAVSVAASRLASQQIGLASQPVSAGDALVPAAERKAGRVEHRRAHARAHARTHRSRGKEPMPGKAEAGTTSAPREQGTRTTSPEAGSTGQASPTRSSPTVSPRNAGQPQQSSPAAPAAPETQPALAPTPPQPAESGAGEDGESNAGPDD